MEMDQQHVALISRRQSRVLVEIDSETGIATTRSAVAPRRCKTTTIAAVVAAVCLHLIVGLESIDLSKLESRSSTAATLFPGFGYPMLFGLSIGALVEIYNWMKKATVPVVVRFRSTVHSFPVRKHKLLLISCILSIGALCLTISDAFTSAPIFTRTLWHIRHYSLGLVYFRFLTSFTVFSPDWNSSLQLFFSILAYTLVVFVGDVLSSIGQFARVVLPLILQIAQCIFDSELGESRSRSSSIQSSRRSSISFYAAYFHASELTLAPLNN